MCSTLILLNVRLNGISHLLVHNNELQIAQKESTTKLRIHLLKTIKKLRIHLLRNIIVTKIILQEKFWEDKTVCCKNYHKYFFLISKNYHKYETKLRKWEAYYSIYCKLMLDFSRTIFENPFGFNATPLCLYTKTNNLEIQ